MVSRRERAQHSRLSAARLVRRRARHARAKLSHHATDPGGRQWRHRSGRERFTKNLWSERNSEMPAANWSPFATRRIRPSYIVERVLENREAAPC